MTAAFEDLVLKGNLTIGGVEMGSEVIEFLITGTRNDVQIPATLSTPKSHAPGAAKYQITIGYLSTDGTGGTLFPALWAAVGTDSKELAFSGRMRNGVVSATNPQWSGTFVVSAADLGGDVESLSQGSITCTLTGAPTRATS